MAVLSPPALLASLVLASLVFRVAPQPQSQRSASEHELKAAFLYNFTRFVTWPDGIPPGAEPFRLCVIADRETTEAIGRTMAGETVNGRPAQTRVPRSAEEARACQLLFVGKDAEHRARPLLDTVRDLPVLTVGDGDAFAQSGGVIQFVVEDGKLRFDISQRNAQRGGLLLSSRLLKVARKLDPEKK